MSAKPITHGETSVSTVIRILDSTTFLPEEAVEHTTSGISLWYRREEAAVTAITPAALASASAAWASGGIEHLDDGYYRLDVPDAAFASGVDGVLIGGTLTGMVVVGTYHPLIAINLQDAVRAGMTALPNAAADAAGGLPISDAGGLDMDAVTIQVIPNNISSFDVSNTTIRQIQVNILDGTGVGVPEGWITNAGTISIGYKAIGDTAFTFPVSTQAMNKAIGRVWYDEVFNTATGYSAGDSITVSLQSIEITPTGEAARQIPPIHMDFELREAMRGTDSAALAADYTSARAGYLENINGHTAQTGDSFARIGATGSGLTTLAQASVATEARLAELDAGNLIADVAAVKAETALIVADTGELQTDWTNGGRLDLIVDAVLADTADIQPKLGTPVASIAADIATVKAETALIVADTGELQTDWANAGRLDTILDACATQASISALNDISVNDILYTQLTEGYAAANVVPSLSQAIFMIHAYLTELSVAGTIATAKQINGSSTAATFTLNDATTPTSILRAT